MSLQDLFAPQIIYEETTAQWINCHDVLHFFGADSGDELASGSRLRFLWSSEESGFRHLYQIEVELVANSPGDDSMSEHQSDENTGEPVVTAKEDTNGAKQPKLDQRTDYSQRSKSGNSSDEGNTSANGTTFGTTPNMSHNSDYGRHQTTAPFESIATLRSKLVSKSQLTHGNWEVSDRDVWCDEHQGLVYFCGLKESPLERHLYVVSLNYPKLSPKRLTAEDFSHTTIAFNPSHKYFVD
ncbi:unnamed protein product, partial [Oppiella nova]